MSDNPQVTGTPTSEPTSVQELGLFKKFGNDLTQWDNSYWSIVEQRKAVEARADAAEQRAMQLEQYLLSQGRQDPNPAPQDPWSQIVGQDGVDPNLLRRGVQADAQQAAFQVFQNLMGPMANAWKAREHLAQKYSDFATLEPELTRFVNDDPELKRKYDAALAASPDTAEMAAELALLRYKASKPLPSPVNQSDRSAAGIPGIAGAGTGGESPIAAFEKELADAVSLAERTGDKGPLYIAASKLARLQAGESL